MGEVDHVQHAEDQGEAHGEEEEEHPVGEAVQRLSEEISGGTGSAGAGGRAHLFDTALTVSAPPRPGRPALGTPHRERTPPGVAAPTLATAGAGGRRGGVFAAGAVRRRGACPPCRPSRQATQAACSRCPDPNVGDLVDRGRCRGRSRTSRTSRIVDEGLGSRCGSWDRSGSGRRGADSNAVSAMRPTQLLLVAACCSLMALTPRTMTSAVSKPWRRSRPASPRALGEVLHGRCDRRVVERRACRSAGDDPTEGALPRAGSTSGWVRKPRARLALVDRSGRSSSNCFTNSPQSVPRRRRRPPCLRLPVLVRKGA